MRLAQIVLTFGLMDLVTLARWTTLSLMHINELGVYCSAMNKNMRVHV